MGKLYKKIIDNFSGGISEDKRSKDFSKYSITKHFDVFTYPHKLVPFVKTKAFDGEDKTKDIVRFVYAPRNSAQTTFQLFGLGIQTGTTKAKVYMNDPGDTADDSWNTPSNGEAAAATRSEDIFFHYKGYIYMYSNGANLDRFDVTSSTSFGDAYQTISYTTTQWQAEPVHHPANDNAYFFANNVVHELASTTWTGSKFTIFPNSSDAEIVACCAFGDFLAIGFVTKGVFDKRSHVWLWDMDSTFATQKIDFGDGVLRHLAVLDGKLIGIVDFYSSNLNAQNKGRLFIKQAVGNSAVILNTITMDNNTRAGLDVGGNNVLSTNTRVVRDNKLYFPAAAELNGDTRLGIWCTDSFGRVSLAISEEEASTIEGIVATANRWWIAHSNDGSTNVSVVLGQESTTNYATTSVYESLKIIGSSPSKNKKLIGVTVNFEPLSGFDANDTPTVVLYYRKDDDELSEAGALESWTQIFSFNTANNLTHSSTVTESDGATLPQFRELQLRVESTGGAVITSIECEYEELDDKRYG